MSTCFINWISLLQALNLLVWTSSKLRAFRAEPEKKHPVADSFVLWCTICCHCHLSIFVLFCFFCFGFTPFNMKGVIMFIMSLASSHLPREHLFEKWHCALFHDKISSATYQIRQFGTSLPCMYLFSIKKQHKLSFQYDNNNDKYIYKKYINNNNHKCQFIESCGKSS